MKYRVKTYQVEAIQWLSEDQVPGLRVELPPKTSLPYAILEENIVCNLGDWILTKEDGTRTVVSDTVFKKYYEKFPDAELLHDKE
jgi:hypothetical protein